MQESTDITRQNAEIKSQDVGRTLLEKFKLCRARSEKICAPLKTEDYGVQPSAEVSPPKWHLAHTTWFFEEMILKIYSPDYKVFDLQFSTLFNSYYKALGPHWKQSERGQISRPTVAEVFAYRAYVDAALQTLITDAKLNAEALDLVVLGLNHEEQHQELLVMDIKALLSANIIELSYSHRENPRPQPQSESTWKLFAEGVYSIGFDQTASSTIGLRSHFAFDNEGPRHKYYAHGFEVSDQLVSNRDYLAFMNDGAYTKPELWLSLGWDWIQKTAASAPLYWRPSANGWQEFSLYGLRSVDMQAPVSHINYFEADAFARWSRCRLPTEEEYEIFLSSSPEAQSDVAELEATDITALRGQLWCWTQSSYSAYPGFARFKGKAEEYNGKFMCQQYVLRGGCVATPPGHYRDTYRNFYLPEQRWMFSGIRLTRDAK